jgi:hypothetical protein
MKNRYDAFMHTARSCARLDALIDSANLRKMAQWRGLSFATFCHRNWLLA